MMKISRLRALFDYYPETGILTRKNGMPAGSRSTNGYRRVMIDQIEYGVHRIAYAMYHDEWPDEEIDHWNTHRSDNRISNLRPASHAENVRNCSLAKNNTSGYKGVCRARGKWMAQIGYQGKVKFLGYFGTAEDAKEFRDLAAAMLHGQFARN